MQGDTNEDEEYQPQMEYDVEDSDAEGKEHDALSEEMEDDGTDSIERNLDGEHMDRMEIDARFLAETDSDVGVALSSTPTKSYAFAAACKTPPLPGARGATTSMSLVAVLPLAVLVAAAVAVARPTAQGG